MKSRNKGDLTNHKKKYPIFVEYRSFELIYGFPPMNFENKKNCTLDEEGLFPASMINIVEK